MKLFGKIICPTDFSEPSRAALKLAGEMALDCEGVLCVVHVVPPMGTVPLPSHPPAFDVAQYEQQLVVSHEKVLHDVIGMTVPRKLLQPPIRVTALVLHGEPAHEIVQLAGREQADLIVMATHGLSGWQRFVFGSVAERVVRLAECPVLTVRPPHDETKSAGEQSPALEQSKESVTSALTHRP